MKGGARRGGPVGLRAGQEHRARQPGIAKSRSERAGARLRHRHHMAPSASVWPKGHSGWRERGERPEEGVFPVNSVQNLSPRTGANWS